MQWNTYTTSRDNSAVTISILSIKKIWSVSKLKNLFHNERSDAELNQFNGSCSDVRQLCQHARLDHAVDWRSGEIESIYWSEKQDNKMSSYSKVGSD